MRGIVYYAVMRNRYLRWAAASAKSAKRHMPDVPITLFTDLSDNPYVQIAEFDSVVEVEPVEKLRCHNLMTAIAHSPYDTTIFLGAGSWVCDDLSEIFDALEHSPLDMMAVLVQQSRYMRKLAPIFETTGVPEAYPRYETGTVGLIKNKRTETFLGRWIARYDELCETWDLSSFCADQPPLRIALYQSPTVRVGVLGNRYNYQGWGFFNEPVKVIQVKAEAEQFRKMEKEANRHPGSPRFLANGQEIWWMKQ